MRKIWPFMLPWPFAMIAPKRSRNSFTMTPESIPARRLYRGHRTSRRSGANNSSPSSCTALARGARQQLRVLDQFRHTDLFTYFSASPAPA